MRLNEKKFKNILSKQKLVHKILIRIEGLFGLQEDDGD
jgi:hypothetical protein